MKRHGNLWDKITELDNIYLAYKKARKGKSWQNTISRFDDDLDENIFNIRDALEGKQHITFTGSIVLMNQLKKYESHLPFLSTIKKINRHYTFS